MSDPRKFSLKEPEWPVVRDSGINAKMRDAKLLDEHMILLRLHRSDLDSLPSSF